MAYSKEALKGAPFPERFRSAAYFFEFETRVVEAKAHGSGGAEKEKICWQCGRTFQTNLDVCPDDGARLIEMGVEDREDPLVGTVFDGRFRIYKKLGEGGMGSVYSARRLDFETEVALKLLKSDFARDEGIRKRFMYEARVISNLKHPHAVRLHDFGQTADGHVYMVMELLHGESLADRLAYRFVTYREVFEIMPPICGVLGEAHTRDVIHRDLKPENIFLLKVEGNREFPKLLDFGIAKHNRAETMTQSGTLWGTPAYMSPEQARGDKVGAPADIYAVGIMVYELISGNLPFHASTQMGFAVKHLNEPARPLSSIPGLESVPDELDHFVLAMLSKRAEDRPSSMEEVASTLERICEECFDDELLDSVPAEEVDPIGLQRWIEEAPDISQTFPAADSREVDAYGATRESQVDGEVIEASRPTEMGAVAGAPVAVASPGPPTWVKVGGGVVALVVVLALAALMISPSEEDMEEVAEALAAGDPMPAESAVSAATIHAAHVVIEARRLTDEMVGEEAPEEAMDLLQEEAAEAAPVSGDDEEEDEELREALRETF